MIECIITGIGEDDMTDLLYTFEYHERFVTPESDLSSETGYTDNLADAAKFSSIREALAWLQQTVKENITEKRQIHTNYGLRLVTLERVPSPTYQISRIHQ